MESRARQGALLSCDAPESSTAFSTWPLSDSTLRAEPVERLLGVLLRVGTGLRELVAGVADRLADLVDLTGQRLDVTAGLLCFLLGLSGLVTLVVEIALETKRPDRETAGDEQEQHTRGNPAPGAVTTRRRRHGRVRANPWRVSGSSPPSPALRRRAVSCVDIRHRASVRGHRPAPGRKRADSPR